MQALLVVGGFIGVLVSRKKLDEDETDSSPEEPTDPTASRCLRYRVSLTPWPRKRRVPSAISRSGMSRAEEVTSLAHCRCRTVAAYSSSLAPDRLSIEPGGLPRASIWSPFFRFEPGCRS